MGNRAAEPHIQRRAADLILPVRYGLEPPGSSQGIGARSSRRGPLKKKSVGTVKSVS